MRIPVSIRTRYFMADKRALVDSGATDNFINLKFARRMGLGLQKLENPKKIYNIDNTSNKSGSITHFLDLKVKAKGITKDMRFLVTDIGNEDILLGYPWLATFEPKFNWSSATIDEQILPVIISSLDPAMDRVTIAGTHTKEQIVEATRAAMHDTRNCNRTSNSSRNRTKTNRSSQRISTVRKVV